MMNALESSSTRPYLIRALYEWCTDNGLTPYVAVLVDDSVQVPREYVKNGEIVLNISFDATSALKLGNEFIEFKARFAGTAREIIVPVSRVLAIYARENGQGMAFPILAGQEPAAQADHHTPLVPPSRPAALRDAARPAGGEPDGKVLHLAGMESSGGGQAEPPARAADPAGKPPQPPSGGGGKRPSLKRIK